MGTGDDTDWLTDGDFDTLRRALDACDPPPPGQRRLAQTIAHLKHLAFAGPKQAPMLRFESLSEPFTRGLSPPRGYRFHSWRVDGSDLRRSVIVCWERIDVVGSDP